VVLCVMAGPAMLSQHLSGQTWETVVWNPMELLRDIFVILHLVGLAAILGGFLEQWVSSSRRITAVMVWGARAQIVTGLALVGLIYANDGEPDNMKIAVKLVIALGIAGLAEANKKKDTPPAAAWWLVGLLTLVNIGVAVIWR